MPQTPEAHGIPSDPPRCDRVFHLLVQLDDGTVFDTTRQPGRKPFSFHLGCAEVIKGWDIGVATMKVGERAAFHIPPEYGYGDATVGPIPPKSNLTFHVELVSARDDTLSKVKWQVLGLLCFIGFLCYVIPSLHPTNTHPHIAAHFASN